MSWNSIFDDENTFDVLLTAGAAGGVVLLVHTLSFGTTDVDVDDDSASGDRLSLM